VQLQRTREEVLYENFPPITRSDTNDEWTVNAV
jgi:hypothetical protein